MPAFGTLPVVVPGIVTAEVVATATAFRFGVSEFEAELAKYESGKGSVRFPLDEPLPLDLVRRIVLRRVEENLEKAAFRRAKKRNQGR